MESNEINSEQKKKKEIPHHKQQELCMNRPAYRQGRKFTAVKVYTVSSESQHLFVYGVPTINLRSELKSLFNKYGELVNIHVVPDQNVEIFTECYHIHYKKIQSARIAKRFVDNKSFYGGILHVCYAPEYETIEETRSKLQQRQKDVLIRLNKYNAESHEKIEELSGETTESELTEEKKLKKRKHPEFNVPSPYTEDPILSHKRKQKKNAEDYIAKYASQSSDVNGRVVNRRDNSFAQQPKKFVPFRYKSVSETQVFGPQLPKAEYLKFNIDKQIEVSNQKNIEGISEKNIQVLNQVDIRKVPNIEKRIIFRNKILNKIS